MSLTLADLTDTWQSWREVPNVLSRGLARFTRTSPIGAVSAMFLFFMLLVAIFAAQLAPYDPIESNYAVARQGPMPGHPLGADHMGRDVLSRIIFGARISIFVGLASVLMGDSIGLLWGAVSGYSGGRVDLVSQRLLDVLLSFPGLILAMLLLVGTGAGLRTVVIAIAATRVPISTRVIRSVALSIKEFAFVEAARALGAPSRRIMLRHIVPQCIAPFLVVATGNLGVAITTEAALSFLGVGVPPPTPTWGNMLGGILAESFRPRWWLVVFPGLALTLTVLTANLFGDAIRDFLDPKLRGRIV